MSMQGSKFQGSEVQGKGSGPVFALASYAAAS